MFIVVFVTVPSMKTGRKIAKELLSKRVAGCINILGRLDSFFWWKEKIDKAKECLLIIKTKKSLFSKLKKIVESLHPYDVPEVIALPLVDINDKYASWLREETK